MIADAQNAVREPQDRNRFGQGGGQHEKDDGGEQVAQPEAGLSPAGPERAPGVGTVLADQEDRPTPLAADCGSLDEAEQDEDRGAQ
jgi:hypothetical protein